MKIKVWDIPTRVFHWTLVIITVACFAVSFFEELIIYHAYLGEAVFGLMIFRIGWGFIGGKYSRFISFIKGPKVVFNRLFEILTFTPHPTVGHNPVAAWMFIAMLAVFGFLGVSGLFMLGGQELIGPLANQITHETAFNLATLHYWVAWILALMVGIHISAAIIDSIINRQNIIKSMFTGIKDYHDLKERPFTDSGQTLKKSFIGIVVLLTCGFIILWPMDYKTIETQEALAKKTDEATEFYREECGACHFAFSPNILPERSWVKMMDELEHHFSDDASLDDEDKELILDFLKEKSLETSKSEASYMLSLSIEANQTPQRVTELAFWKEKHNSINKQTFKQKNIRSSLNCGACHRHALYGSFEDSHIQVPKPGEKPSS